MLSGFSSRLKNLRSSKNLTQTEVADYARVSRSMISAYETDMRFPSYDVLLRLAALFGVSTDFLLGSEKRRYLDISGLSEREAASVSEIVELLKTSHVKGGTL